jgi:hypothetical protein
LGRDEGAHAVVEEIIKLNPNLSIKTWFNIFPQMDQGLKKRIQSVLLNVGMPE